MSYYNDWNDMALPYLTEDSIRTWCQLAGSYAGRTDVKLPETIELSWTLTDDPGDEVVRVIIKAGAEVSLHCHMKGGKTSSTHGTIFTPEGGITIMRKWRVKDGRQSEKSRAIRRAFAPTASGYLLT